MQFYLGADNVVILKLVALCSDQSVTLKDQIICLKVQQKLINSHNLWLTLNFPLGRVDHIKITKFSENLNDLNKLNNLHIIQLLFIEVQSLLTIIGQN